MTMAHSSVVVALALGLAGPCGTCATSRPQNPNPRWTDETTAGGGCPIGEVSIRLFYSDCRSDADLGPVSVLGVRYDGVARDRTASRVRLLAGDERQRLSVDPMRRVHPVRRARNDLQGASL
jgi:hypothetical protein